MERKQETEHIVAFLDLLGASEIISGKNEDMKSEDVLSNISGLFRLSQEAFPQAEFVHPALKNLKYATFSDNIVFALDLSKWPSDEIENIIPRFLLVISYFQNMALGYKLLFRGGVSLGPLYMDVEQNFVWGKALVDAHYLEEKVAVYPRVVLSREFEQRGYSLPKTLVNRDFDGVCFLDTMRVTIMMHPDWCENALDLVKREYEKSSPRQENVKWGHERILQKYAWLQSYIEKNKPKTD